MTYLFRHPSDIRTFLLYVTSISSLSGLRSPSLPYTFAANGNARFMLYYSLRGSRYPRFYTCEPMLRPGWLSAWSLVLTEFLLICVEVFKRRGSLGRIPSLEPLKTRRHDLVEGSRNPCARCAPGASDLTFPMLTARHRAYGSVRYS